MTWARLDDAMPDHPKILSAGALAELIDYRAICYANRYLTDGFIALSVLPRLMAGLERIFDGPHEELAGRLVQAGLWTRARGGWRIHDFLSYNPSRSETLLARSRNTARQQAFRERNGVTNASRNGPVTAPPSPSPSPSPVPKIQKTYSGHFEDFWTAYPKHVGKGEALKAWKQGRCDTNAAFILEAVGRQMAYFQAQGPKYTPNPATWLNQKRWDDDPPVASPVSEKTRGNIASLQAFVDRVNGDAPGLAP